MMKSTIIHDCAPFRLVRYGDGSAYDFINLDANRDVYFQGGDAIEFYSELEALTEGKYGLDYRDAFAVLWSGYSEISTELVA